MKKQIVVCSLYYRKNSTTATNRIFDEVWSRIYRNYDFELLTIVPKGECPPWINKESCIEVSYNQGIFERLTTVRYLNEVLEDLSSSIVINDFLPIPLVGLEKHIHVQFICHIYSKNESLIRHLGVINQLHKIKELSYILTISETSKSEIIKLGNFNPKQVLVSYCGISQTLLNSTPFNSAKNNYDLLYVATFIPRKNHINLIRALPLIGRPVKLALLGQDLGCRNKVKALTKKLGLQEYVDFLAPMSENEMAALFSRSRVFVSPSLREGFGMPVAEALAIGLPVACSDIAVFREVAGAWACYFNPYNPASIAKELKSILNFYDTYANQARDGKIYARGKFSWDSIVERLVIQLNNIYG